MMKTGKIVCFFLLFPLLLTAQEKGSTNTSRSSYVKLKNVAMTDVRWTKGFWAERFEVYKDTLILNMWKTRHRPSDIMERRPPIKFSAKRILQPTTFREKPADYGNKRPTISKKWE